MWELYLDAGIFFTGMFIGVVFVYWSLLGFKAPTIVFLMLIAFLTPLIWPLLVVFVIVRYGFGGYKK